MAALWVVRVLWWVQMGLVVHPVLVLLGIGFGTPATLAIAFPGLWAHVWVGVGCMSTS